MAARQRNNTESVCVMERDRGGDADTETEVAVWNGYVSGTRSENWKDMGTVD